MNNTNKLPIFMQDEKINKILSETIVAVPKGSHLYLVGGALRNAIFYKIFKEKLPQRDYDLVFLGDKNRFIENLRKFGFVYGKIRRKYDIVFKKKKVSKPRKTNYSDYVVLDISFVPQKNIMASMKEEAGLTINGFSLELKHLNSEKWFDKIIELPGAMDDLKNKRLKVNAIKHPGLIYSCIRFMHLGFKAPSKKDTEILLKHFAKFEKWRFQRNVDKVFAYVNGERNARKYAKRLGISDDIFDWKTFEKLRTIYGRNK